MSYSFGSFVNNITECDILEIRQCTTSSDISVIKPRISLIWEFMDSKEKWGENPKNKVLLKIIKWLWIRIMIWHLQFCSQTIAKYYGKRLKYAFLFHPNEFIHMYSETYFTDREIVSQLNKDIYLGSHTDIFLVSYSWSFSWITLLPFNYHNKLLWIWFDVLVGRILR